MNNREHAEKWIADLRAALGYHDFMMFQCARAARIVATEMVSVAVGWQVYEITGRPDALGYTGLAQFAPAFALFLVAGNWADRFDRRKILLACFASYAACAAALAVAALNGAVSMATIYALVAFAGTTAAFAGPAAQALAPQLVPAEYLPNAIAWGSAVFTLFTIVGPVFGGLLYVIAGGPGPVYALAASVYAGALWITARTRTKGPEQADSLSVNMIFGGVRYVRDHRVILGCMSLDLFAVLLGGAIALLPILSKDILHTGVWGLGLLRSSAAAGAVLTALCLARNPLKKQAGVKMLWCVALFGFSTVILGLSSKILISITALLFIGGADAVSVIVRGTLIQQKTPPEMRGRVSAVNLLFTGASNQIGQFEPGLTAQWLGVVPSVTIGGLGTLLVVAIWAWRFPEIRAIERP